jgi:hypothetical protein
VQEVVGGAAGDLVVGGAGVGVQHAAEGSKRFGAGLGQQAARAEEVDLLDAREHRRDVRLRGPLGEFQHAHAEVVRDVVQGALGVVEGGDELAVAGGEFGGVHAPECDATQADSEEEIRAPSRKVAQP